MVDRKWLHLCIFVFLIVVSLNHYVLFQCSGYNSTISYETMKWQQSITNINILVYKQHYMSDLIVKLIAVIHNSIYNN